MLIFRESVEISIGILLFRYGSNDSSTDYRIKVFMSYIVAMWIYLEYFTYAIRENQPSVEFADQFAAGNVGT